MQDVFFFFFFLQISEMKWTLYSRPDNNWYAKAYYYISDENNLLQSKTQGNYRIG